ncbi:formate/nitrite transporter family protein [Pseudoroseomonas deserti]|uniref:Formate/nitrite transporter family protein n=1 Tax=Teichococcus deserti TaxID=1817963 RepID=A0A1V2H2M8_9PROT|nr:formate/nitrite transporter family protein [Pseudoroseomonas deserti]ONG51626.1 formate/nitrite transporter family protein [Pseudoroseomonas deserti]
MDDARKDPAGSAIAVLAPGLLAAKAEQPWLRMLLLAGFAGGFIAFGSVISMVAQSGGGGGAVQLLSGFAFSVGLIMVMVVGAELFTGNTMMVLPAATGALRPARMAGAWAVVWLGNLAGSLAVAALYAAAGGLDDSIGAAAREMVQEKLAKSALATFCSAILANMLVCLAVWMAMAAPRLPAKILAIVGPVMIFVAAGLEHSVANMSIIPLGWLAMPAEAVLWSEGARNLLWSSLGNLAGGALLALGLAQGHGALRQGSAAAAREARR